MTRIRIARLAAFVLVALTAGIAGAQDVSVVLHDALWRSGEPTSAAR